MIRFTCILSIMILGPWVFSPSLASSAVRYGACAQTFSYTDENPGICYPETNTVGDTVESAYNQALSVRELDQVCQLDASAERLLNAVMEKLNLSVRVYHRILKVARTIADLEARESLHEKHISEALTYRYLDRMKTVM